MKYKLFLIALLFIFNKSFSQDTAAVRLNNYREQISSIVTKANSLYDNITKAIAIKDITGIEASRIALQQHAEASIKKVNSIENFDGDAALKYSSRDVLKFYKEVAERDMLQVRDFFTVEQNFIEVKKEFKKKPDRRHSSEEIKNYIAEIDKYNAASSRYILLTNFIAAGRKTVLYNWNATEKLFADANRQIP